MVCMKYKSEIPAAIVIELLPPDNHQNLHLSTCTQHWVIRSLVPRLPRNVNMYTQKEPPVFFLHKHDIIKIGPEQNCNVLHIVQLCVQRLVCAIIDPQQLDTCSIFPTAFALFPVLSLWVCSRTITCRSLCSLSIFESTTWEKIPALHAYTTSMFAFRTREAWEETSNHQPSHLSTCNVHGLIHVSECYV